ncbi:MAG: response regulator transcription factor [Pseudomonadota bacterium]|nr:response regulator transcription factor [Pseudomonadota bacterium]
MPDDSLVLTPALVVEDDLSMQRRIARLLGDVEPGAEVVVTGSLAGARELLAAREFSIALVDIGLPDGNGCELIAWLSRHRPDMQVLVISAWGDEDTVLSALRSGAIGYLLKEREDIELTLSLRSIQRGGAPIDPAIAKRILALLPTQAPRAQPVVPEVHLSAREHEILALVSRGCSNREIAALVSLSRLTIEGYTKSIYRKLAVGSRTEAVHEAKALGLLQ